MAALQRDFDYQPVYPWGAVLRLLELLLTSTLVALFLLALRRRARTSDLYRVKVGRALLPVLTCLLSY